MSATPWPAMPGALVVARFAQIHGDGTDTDDQPDWIAPDGTELMFVPSITGPLVYDPLGAKIIVEVAPFRAVVDADGFAVAREGGHPIKLAPTDDPLMSRTGWLWTCSWAGGKVSFPAPSSGAINIADYIVAPPGNPVVEEWVARIPELVALIEAGTDPAAIAAAVEDYLIANPPASAPDATTAAKGILQLAGDLGGTATAPTVPGLADKADADHNHDGTYAPVLGPDDNYVTDAEKAALHTHPAVIAQGATMADARAAIGAVPTSRTVAGKALTDDITLAAADLTDFTEASQDVVGAMVAAAGGTYNDAGGSITLPAGGGGGAPSFDWMPPSGAWLNQQTESPGPQSYVDPNRWAIAPIVLPDGMPSVDRLAMQAGAMQPFAVALYQLSATRGQLTLIRDLGVITPAATGIVEVTLSPSLTLPRLVYVAVKRGTAATSNAQLYPATSHAGIWVGGLGAAASSSTAAYWSPWQGTDAAPATVTVGTAGSALKPPVTMWRIA